MEEFKKSGEAVLRDLKTNSEGLSGQEAAQRLERYGKNGLAEGKRKGMIQVFLEQFKDLLIAILIVAGIVSMFSGQFESTIVIFAVIVLNAVLGTIQHFKAEKSLASLKELSSPTAKVMRDDIKLEVRSEDLVPGDILILEAGDLVTADARILENYSLKVNESSLTGESEPVEKTTGAIDGEKVALGDRKNMVFSGSLVTYGASRGRGYGHRHGDRAGEDCRLAEPHCAASDAAADHSGSFQPEARLGDHWNLLCGLWPFSVSADADSGCPAVRRGAGCCRHSGSTQLHCDHSSRHGNTKDGTGERGHEGSESGGESWQRFCDLLG